MLRVNVSGVLRRLQTPPRSNVAYAIAHRERSLWANLDTWYGSLALLEAVRAAHSMRHRARDVLIFTRPDVVFSAAINVPRFAALASHHLLFLPHVADSGAIGSGNDPSETFLMVSVDVWKRLWAYTEGGLRGRVGGCAAELHQSFLGIPTACANASAAYVGAQFGLWLHRWSFRARSDTGVLEGTVGDSEPQPLMAINVINRRQGDRQFNNTSPLPMADVTKGARCVWPAAATPRANTTALLRSWAEQSHRREENARLEDAWTAEGWRSACRVVPGVGRVCRRKGLFWQEVCTSAMDLT
jgi:hypothetical protein